jgi:pimeloyl-ACP methyl ester carboxylesterase
MNSVEMLYLKNLLEKQHFTVHSLSYQSIKYTISENTQRLHSEIASLGCTELHIVAHSLGGVLAMHLLEKHPELPVKRVVMLGTPIRGSYAAEKISRWNIIGRLLTKSMAGGLDGNHDFKANNHQIGMIAGSIKSPIGLGLLLGKLPEENDGTVLLSETKHPVVSEHLVVDKSHTGLIFSSMVCDLVTNYLRTGHFSK